MSSEKQNISFYLTNDETKQKITGDNSNMSSSEKYIILQNDCLNAINNELREKINSMQVELKDLEEETDKNDERTRYMRNEMKNFVELRIMTNEVLSMFENKYKVSELKYKTIIELYKCLINFIFFNKILSLGGRFVLWYFDRFNLVSVLITEIISGVSAAYATKLSPGVLKKTKKLLESYETQTKKFDSDIMEQKKNIKVTDDSNDFITKYIDSL